MGGGDAGGGARSAEPPAPGISETLNRALNAKLYPKRNSGTPSISGKYFNIGIAIISYKIEVCAAPTLRGGGVSLKFNDQICVNHLIANDRKTYFKYRK